jgi:hypothetical protein
MVLAGNEPEIALFPVASGRRYKTVEAQNERRGIPKKDGNCSCSCGGQTSPAARQVRNQSILRGCAGWRCRSATNINGNPQTGQRSPSRSEIRALRSNDTPRVRQNPVSGCCANLGCHRYNYPPIKPPHTMAVAMEPNGRPWRTTANQVTKTPTANPTQGCLLSTASAR